ncbi:MAG: adenine phosphoribosyltransferase [Firmicutes bacterium]|nr:adenine phosphoribosyltransferase [Bacillota bacterium]
MKHRQITILGETRSLPISKIGNIEIAGFDSVGDMQIILKVAKELHSQIIEVACVGRPHIIITTELKGLPLSQELARLLNIDYLVLRKSEKVYMGECICLKGESITSGESNYYLSKTNFEKMKNKNILFVDDVFSTGKTMETILELAKQTNANLISAFFILREQMDGQDNDKVVKFSHEGIPCIACGTLKCSIVQ